MSGPSGFFSGTAPANQHFFVNCLVAGNELYGSVYAMDSYIGIIDSTHPWQEASSNSALVDRVRAEIESEASITCIERGACDFANRYRLGVGKGDYSR